jgi:hypothetical protein
MNQGLEALATLASASPPSPAWSGIVTNNLTHTLTHNSNQKTTHGANGDTLASTSSGSAPIASVRSHPLFSASNPVQTPPNGNSSQWQQAPQQGGNEMNSAVLSNSNLALIMGMQQRQSQSQPQSDQVLALLQQQLSYYRHNMNSSQPGHQMAAGTRDRRIQQTSTTALEPHQELTLALALQAHQSEQQNGKSLISSTLSPFVGIEIHCDDGVFIVIHSFW